MLFPVPISITIPDEKTRHREIISDSEEERVFNRTTGLQSHPSPVKAQHRLGAREVIYISSDEDDSEYVAVSCCLLFHRIDRYHSASRNLNGHQSPPVENSAF